MLIHQLTPLDVWVVLVAGISSDRFARHNYGVKVLMAEAQENMQQQQQQQQQQQDRVQQAMLLPRRQQQRQGQLLGSQCDRSSHHG
jgi:hypothetical protein